MRSSPEFRTARREWVAELIRDHRASGNKPDHERARRLASRLNELAAQHEPTDLSEMTEDEILDLAVEQVGQYRADEARRRRIEAGGTTWKSSSTRMCS